MNYVDGKIIEREQCAEVIASLPDRIARTLAGKPINPEDVILACDSLSKSLDERHLQLLLSMGMDAAMARKYIDEAKSMLSAEYLRHKLKTELGDWRQHTHEPPFGAAVEERIMPLGVLFHIAAGNMDALPAYTIVEGLLAGNINIAKLPGGDNGLSVHIVDELVKAQPSLAEYVYIFDYSSEDTTELQQLAALADAVVVWGGDAAVSAARAMARPNTRVIEWGHKLSFAYGVPDNMSEDDFLALAASMVETQQLLCSSCQGLYIDTEDMSIVHDYAKSMLQALDACAKDYNPDIGIRAQVGLAAYTEHLESQYKQQHVFRGERCNVIACRDSGLTPAIQFGNCWVKPLPRDRIIQQLKPYKNHLQTAALLCAQDEREEISTLLWRAGVVRISNAGNMSDAYCGMPHDGEYTLRRYTRVVSR